jgi:hypothetical protein
MRAFFLMGSVDRRIGAQLDFYRHSGRREAAISDAQLRSGESRDSGFVLPRPGMTATGTSRYD